MAFKGRDEATEFEKATVTIFRDVFGFRAEHIGPIGRTPDVLVLSDKEGFSGIIDNKAYSRYSISNDHRNRMVHNYIPTYKNGECPLAFFSYIAGGFGANINQQLKSIADEVSVNGSALSVSNMIKMIERQELKPYSHCSLKSIFSLNRQILLSDIVF